MQLTKSDALYLYSILFHYEQSSKNAQILSRLKTFLIGEDAECDSNENEEECESAIMQEFVADAQIEGSVLHELPAHSVTVPTGETTTLEFEQDDDSDGVNALFYGGSLVLDDIQGLKLSDSQGKMIQLFDGEEWHDYPVNRFAKVWLNKFNLNETYQIVS